MNAAKKNDKYFEEDSAGRVAFASIVLFLVCFGAACGGVYIMSLAFDPLMDTPLAVFIFCAGLVVSTAGFMIAFIRPSQVGKEIE